MAERPEIVVVTKTYSGQEGNRVKAGTRFAVVKEKGGLPVITAARYQALVASKLVRPFGQGDAKVAPGAGPLPATITTLEGPAGKTVRATRQAQRTRAKQTENPEAPKQVAGPQHGSQTGAAAPSASSAAAPVSEKSTSARRGTRPSASPSSTTPSR